MRIQPLKDFSTLREVVAPSDAKVERAVPKAVVKHQNEASMAALKGMLSGVQGAPGGKRK